MNHIQKLTEENKLLKEWVDDLERYVSSDKFATNVMVNKGDITLRISELRRKFFQNGLSLTFGQR